ncbi:uncharacterized protein Z520_00113 [Fonsecaea multimorphosa CBS 102226]|uniref:Sphingoid long-chain base transporter RSB1 n=1 Tax=Fonsecaea multimorphosa CBS 102226 TaxID=1442371 RepID=A0A0D2J243_9EURO|nr:uncharacterized protein Z520_00113 [Fonsecaea multimorphosa CBS 102226]KIY03422.1 hypothetical protein Z520_00113 [Fonsecaea multimorphosa CBS 102226]OAL33071.1 hypothetical protein AYO22_00156 [Fonsecaea multimorphosa]
MSAPANCTIATCSIKEYGQIQYIPTLVGNAIYTGIFGLLLLLQLLLGIRYRTWGFLVGMTCGIVLEIVGYVGRLMLNNDIFDKNSFIIYLIGLTIGPAFLTAAIYLCLSRIITIHALELSLLKPRTIACIFVACDFVSLLLQATGGAIASTADDNATNQIGIDVMIAGLASQVVSLAIFMALCSHFAWKVFKNPDKLNPEHATLRGTLRFKGFLAGIAIAVITITVRSCYRLAELQDGFDGALANNELVFMILEGPMIIAAVTALTVWHPGFVLGAKLWNEAGFHAMPTTNNLGHYKEVNDSSAEQIAMPSLPPQV